MIKYRVEWMKENGCQAGTEWKLFCELNAQVDAEVCAKSLQSFTNLVRATRVMCASITEVARFGI